MSPKKYYITTPLYYVSAPPHLGHAYTTIAADILARYKRGKGFSVHFLTGTDEHGAKIEKAARDAGCSPREWVDGVSEKYRELWRRLNISYDDFIRTTEPRHTLPVQRVFERLLASGDIYKGAYSGLYCLACEAFYDEGELLEGGLCPVHKRPLERVEEETYFFRLSKYEGRLLEHYAAHPSFLAPEQRAREIINWVRGGLKDISISRSKVGWGIKVPSDPAHAIYVWWDALENYATAAGLGEVLAVDEAERSAARAVLSKFGAAGFNDIWPADIHFVGKEIYRFHAVIWPAMLMALELPLPVKVFAHGWWTVNGEKMSKTIGNVVDPAEVAREYGVDALRYFLFRETPFGGDGDFSPEALRRRYNSELANDLGNLVNRTANMVDKYLGGELPSRPPEGGFRLLELARSTAPRIDAHMEALEFDRAIDKIWSVLNELNRGIEREKPWVLARTDMAGLKLFLFELVWCLRMAATWLEPFMPDAAVKIHCQLGVRTPSPLDDGGASIAKAPFLFPRR